MTILVRVIAAISVLFAVGGLASPSNQVKWTSVWSICLSGTALWTGDWWWLVADFAGLWIAKLMGLEPK